MYFASVQVKTVSLAKTFKSNQIFQDETYNLLGERVNGPKQNHLSRNTQNHYSFGRIM